MLEDDYDGDVSESWSYGTCSFSLYLDLSVGCVSDWSFSPIGVQSKYDVVIFLMFVPIGFESIGGQLIEMFWRSNS